MRESHCRRFLVHVHLLERHSLTYHGFHLDFEQEGNWFSHLGKLYNVRNNFLEMLEVPPVHEGKPYK